MEKCEKICHCRDLLLYAVHEVFIEVPLFQEFQEVPLLYSETFLVARLQLSTYYLGFCKFTNLQKINS